MNPEARQPIENSRPTREIPTSAVAWMDRLSDRLGAFIPGGSRWPARHPVKVSLVMGLLGLISGWGSMAFGAAVTVLRGQPPFDEQPTFLASGVLLAAVVMLPWAAWIGTRYRWFIPLAVYCSAANYTCYCVSELDRRGNNEIGLIEFGFLSGLYLSAAGQCLTRRFHPLWCLVIAVISGAAIGSHLILWNCHLFDPLLIRRITIPLVIAWFFSSLHMTSAICLGYLLWDHPPRPKFLPDDGLS